MRWWLPILIAAVAAVALILFALSDGATAARAWLCAFVLISMIPIGSLVLLLVHGISGGRWGEDFAPVLVPAARTIPLLFVAFLPVMFFRPLIYHWNELALPHDVTQFYLDPLFFDARTLIGLLVWSVLAWTSAWRTPTFAMAGIVAHLVVISFLPADWVLTIPPGSVSAGFGLGFGVEQIFAAAAFVAIIAPQAPGRANRDLAGIMLTALLGTVYFFYMAFIITWYGNIPAKVHWYAVRAGDGWALEMLAAFLIGAVLPFLAILNPAVRREPPLLRIVGALALMGIALHIVWMIIPAFGVMTIIPAILAGLIIAPVLWSARGSLLVLGGAHGR
ncbi:MAG TPA: hypothetical protein VGH02_10995 [Rhizomicrobium sp.]|jgi:hypothetical protein